MFIILNSTDCLKELSMFFFFLFFSIFLVILFFKVLSDAFFNKYGDLWEFYGKSMGNLWSE